MSKSLDETAKEKETWFKDHIVLSHFKGKDFETALFGTPDNSPHLRFRATFAEGTLAVTGDLYAGAYNWYRPLCLTAFNNVSVDRLKEKRENRFLDNKIVTSHAAGLRALAAALKTKEEMNNGNSSL